MHGAHICTDLSIVNTIKIFLYSTTHTLIGVLVSLQISLYFRLQRDILVYTGTVGILAYKNSLGVETEFFLGHEGNVSNEEAIPVPKYYWTIIYDEKQHKGIAFLGLNNPHSLDVTDYLCPNVCDKITWLEPVSYTHLTLPTNREV